MFISIDSTLLDITKKNDSGIDDSQNSIYQFTNKKGQIIYIEAAALGADEAGNVLPTLNVEDEDVRALRRHLDSDRDGKLEKRELAATKITEAQNVQLIDNHAFRSQVSRKFEASGVRFQWASPKNFLGMSKGGTLDFADDIVSVGTDEKGEIITFICPEVTKTSKLPFGLSTSFTGEVEIGMVAGSIDTITGAGTIYLDDVNWLFWGSVESNTELGIKKYGIAERDAARVPVWSNRGRGALIVLDNVTAGAYAGQDAGKIFSSFVVKAQQGVTPKQPLAQQLLISAINDLVFPGLLSQGTSLQWNIDLKQGIPVDGLA